MTSNRCAKTSAEIARVQASKRRPLVSHRRVYQALAELGTTLDHAGSVEREGLAVCRALRDAARDAEDLHAVCDDPAFRAAVAAACGVADVADATGRTKP